MPDTIAGIAEAARRGDHDYATRLAEAAIASGVSHPLAFHVRAIARERRGDAEGALADYRHALALSPRDIGIFNTLGLCLMRLGRHGEATEALEQAIALAPSHAQSHHNLGLIRKAAGDLPASVRHFETATTLAPAHAEAHAQLALLAAQRGDWAAARVAGERALAIDPASPNALRALAQADLGEGRPREAETRLRAWLARPLSTAIRHDALGLLGDVLDAQDRIDEAFAAYQESNAILRAASAPLYENRAAPSVLQTLEWLGSDINAVGHALSPPVHGGSTVPSLSRDREGGTPGVGSSARHVFLVGFMRSGTTLLEQALANHPDVVTLEEYEALADSTRAFLSAPGGLQALAAIDEATADRYRQHYWARVREAGVSTDGKLLLDKHPFNAVKLPLVAKLFPNAKVIFATRDPRDVIFSCFRHRLRLGPFTYELLDLANAARFYDRYMTLIERYRAALDIEIIDYRHEALVADFEGTLRPLSESLGLGWSDAMRDVGARVRQGLTISQSASQIRAGLNASGVAHWRRYAAHLSPILDTLAPWVRRFGYESA